MSAGTVEKRSKAIARKATAEAKSVARLLRIHRRELAEMLSYLFRSEGDRGTMKWSLDGVAARKLAINRFHHTQPDLEDLARAGMALLTANALDPIAKLELVIAQQDFEQTLHAVAERVNELTAMGKP
jgi:hypothetical protein